jgi:hypothetical protein
MTYAEVCSPREGMSLMSARRLAVIVAVSLCSLAAGLALGAPAAFAETCPNEAARSGPSASLPECRAYEMVTPADKSSIANDMSFTSGATEEAIPAVDGNRIAVDTNVEGLGQTPDPYRSLVVFTRTPNGWQTQSMAPPNLGAAEVELLGTGFDPPYTFTPDLSLVAFNTTDPYHYPETLVRTFYAGPPGGPFLTLAEPFNYFEFPEHDGWLPGATPNFSSVFIESHHPLDGAPSSTVPEAAQDLYRWENNGRVSMVNSYENGSPVGLCGADFRAVAENGSKVFFTTPLPIAYYQFILREPGCEEPQRLYMRVGSSIVDISEPEAGVVDPTGFHEVEFKGASANGSKVFFTTTTELTKEDEGNHQLVLYEYNTKTSTLTDISRGADFTPGEQGADTVIVPENGSRVYYIGGSSDSLYRYNTETKETREIARNVTAGTSGGSSHIEGNKYDGNEGMRVTPDGKALVWYSHYGINGTDAEPGRNADYQVFRYDDETGEVACISCLPADAPRNKASENGEAWFLTPDMETGDRTPPYTVVSNSGEDVFFESTAQLVPRAVNATGGGLESIGPTDEGTRADIYEWHNGVISLISSPTDAYTQVLLGASEDGSNVFFVTHSQLVPQDIDSFGDIYDARIDGGFPPTVEAAPCQGDTCVHPPPELNDPTPGSLSFSGPGNPPVKVLEPKVGTKPKSKRCAKGKVRERGRCVRERRKAAPAARRHGAVRRSARRLVKHDRGGGK